MRLRLVLSPLRRHKTATALIVLEIALTCAIVSNALFLVSQRLEAMRRPSGIDDQARVLTFLLSGIGKHENAAAQTRADLRTLRAIAGVEQASLINQLPHYPHSVSISRLTASREPADASLDAAHYIVSEDAIATLGLRLVAGRDFHAEEYIDEADAASVTQLPTIISQSLADALFPGRSAIGQRLYGGDPYDMTVIGIVQMLPWPVGRNDDDKAFIVPLRQDFESHPYIVRIADPAQADRISQAATDALVRNRPNRLLLNALPYAQIHSDFFRNDRAMIGLLLTICICLLVVTALGIVGLASFWVQQRSRQIGIRRALGATRGQILRHFQVENFLITSLGVVLGMLGAYAINQWLMQYAELPRLPLFYLPAGALILWLLGQLAALGPARRAAMIPPAQATRGEHH